MDGASGKTRLWSAVYTIDDEGFEENSAVAGSSGKFVDHAEMKTTPEWNVLTRLGREREILKERGL